MPAPGERGLPQVLLEMVTEQISSFRFFAHGLRDRSRCFLLVPAFVSADYRRLFETLSEQISSFSLFCDFGLRALGASSVPAPGEHGLPQVCA